MSTKGQVGSRVKPDLIDQLNQRSAAFSKDVKTRDQLTYINSNTAWVKLRSAVNQIDPDEYKKLDKARIDGEVSRKLKHNAELAQAYVLQGGTRSTSKESVYGRERAGISREPNTINVNRAYNNFPNGLGYRPMPGITGLSVKSKNTYGTLLEAVVDIKVFSLEELEAIEFLYFRPGYTALLEWGHSIYLDNEGNIVTTQNTGLSDSEWFSKNDNNEIDKAINDKRASAQGNYDGMYGFITNFSFDYNEDGSYDCTVKIISRGVILEGLQPSSTSDYVEDSDNDKEDTIERDKSLYHFIFYYTALGASRGKDTLDKHLSRNKKQTSSIANHIKKSQDYIVGEKEATLRSYGDIPVYTTDIEMEVDENWFFDKDISLQFLHLGDWLRIFNTCNIITDPANDYKKRTNDYLFDINPGNKYTTYPDHYSIDPIVAYPTAKPQGKLGSGERIKEKWYKSSVVDNDVVKESICYYDGPGFANTDLHKLWTATVKDDLDRYGGTDDVLSIPISTYTVQQEIEALIGSNTSRVSLFDVLENLLDKVSSALGGIVDLDLFYNYERERYQVIDRNHRIPESLPTINLTGLGSIATNLQVSSTISSNIATQIAIAAQGNSGNSSDNLAVMMEWNRGAIDRHTPYRSTSNEKDDEKKEKRKAKFLKNLRLLYTQFSNKSIFRDHKYNPELVSSIRTEAKKHQVGLLKKYQASTGAPPTGVVPVELSFEILGIHGFLIGTAFKVNKGFLPSKYDNWAYIVTGISHTIQNNKWYTNVKTQFFPDRSAEPVDLGQQGLSLQLSSDFAESLAVSEEEFTEAVLNDPAPVINSDKNGQSSYSSSPVWRDVYRKGFQNGHLDKKDENVLVFIGEYLGANPLYQNPRNNNKPEYMLHPDAARAWFRWRSEMQSKGIKYRVSSAYRSQKHQSGLGGGKTVASPGSSPHGVGGALDFANLYQLVGGSGNPKVNLTRGRLTAEYKQLAEIGAKYGWYNPWRLSDNSGTDECWHFEYWGDVKDSKDGVFT